MITDNDLKGIRDFRVFDDKILCRKLKVASTGSIKLTETTEHGGGWFVVVDHGSKVNDIFGFVEPGAVILGNKYAGAPIYDMTDPDPDRQGAFYQMNADEILGVIPAGSEKAKLVRESHDIIRTVSQD